MADTPLAVELRTVELATLKPQALNARFMTAEQMRRLTDNIRRDGRLTSSILVYQPPGQAPEILSGHHRVEAALAAGVREGEAHVILEELSHQRKVAIQLSHNAIAGQDDPAQLAELYRSLDDLGEKLYFGLTDDDVGKFEAVDILSLASLQPDYEEVTLLFLAGQEQQFADALAEIAKVAGRAQPGAFHFARFEDFDRFFEAMVATKEYSGVYNSATAIRIMAELALERIDQLREEEDGEEAP